MALESWRPSAPAAQRVERLDPQPAASYGSGITLKLVPTERQELDAAFNKPVPTSVTDLGSMEKHLQVLVPRVSPAVVAVEVGFGSGSGVIISGDGYVLSAGHVCVAPGRTVLFTFPDGRTASGKTVGVDLESDTGLMRITDPVPRSGSWPHVAVGDLELAHAGDWVLALGHPGGFDVKRSLVVRFGRVIQVSEDDIQTDCTISPGDSGGPLLDMQGRVIGIHSFISELPTENFHVPIRAFYNNWERLVHPGGGAELASLPRVYLGADAVDDTGGCRMRDLEEDGPAFKAGLRPGDVVVKVEGREILAAATFRRWLAEAKPGETLTFEVSREGKPLSVKVRLAPPTKSKLKQP
jgi:serine protease Do